LPEKKKKWGQGCASREGGGEGEGGGERAEKGSLLLKQEEGGRGPTDPVSERGSKNGRCVECAKRCARDDNAGLRNEGFEASEEGRAGGKRRGSKERKKR